MKGSRPTSQTFGFRLPSRHGTALRWSDFLFFQAVSCAKGVIPAFLRHQGLVVSALNYPALLKHQNLIGVSDCRKPVRNHKNRPAAHKAIHSVLNKFFSPCVHGACGFIQNKNRRICNSGAAMERSCLCPWLKLPPSPEITVS